MEERKLHLWEIVKGCQEGAWIEGDYFKNEKGMAILLEKDVIKYLSFVKINDKFNYGGNFENENN